MEEDKAKGTNGNDAAQDEATVMATDILVSLGIPASIETAGTTTEESGTKETLPFQHVEPVDEEEKKEDEAWAQELVRRSRLDLHAGNV